VAVDPKDVDEDAPLLDELFDWGGSVNGEMVDAVRTEEADRE
jgi:hypothetical protein